jgi:hypothetical protein
MNDNDRGVVRQIHPSRKLQAVINQELEVASQLPIESGAGRVKSLVSEYVKTNSIIYQRLLCFGYEAGVLDIYFCHDVEETVVSMSTLGSDAAPS